MAKTYEALIKAEEERQRSPLKTKGKDFSPGSSEKWAEEYHRLKLHILRLAPTESIRALLFSSPGEQEGTSTVLFNFAISLASQKESVLLVDANFRSPALHQMFSLKQEHGLAELALGKAKWQEVVKKTSFDRLGVITCGEVLFNPPLSLFEEEAFEASLKEMKGHVDWILLDAPSINRFEETLALSAKADGVILVLQAEKTRWEVAQSAKERLEASGGRVLGVVLNKRKYHIPDWLYKTL